jgi:hypothetical protein
MKYIVIKVTHSSGSFLMPFIFPDLLNHDETAKLVRMQLATRHGWINTEVRSAGSIDSLDGVCHGKSETLKVGCHEEDTDLIKTYDSNHGHFDSDTSEKETLPKRTLSDGSPITEAHREINPKTGMQKNYVVLSKEEREKVFVRPVRKSYIHLTCHKVTKISKEIAETYARQPDFYSATFCSYCATHFPLEEFVWAVTNEKVGS